VLQVLLGAMRLSAGPFMMPAWTWADLECEDIQPVAVWDVAPAVQLHKVLQVANLHNTCTTRVGVVGGLYSVPSS